MGSYPVTSGTRRDDDDCDRPITDYLDAKNAEKPKR